MRDPTARAAAAKMMPLVENAVRRDDDALPICRAHATAASGYMRHDVATEREALAMRAVISKVTDAAS